MWRFGRRSSSSSISCLPVALVLRGSGGGPLLSLCARSRLSFSSSRAAVPSSRAVVSAPSAASSSCVLPLPVACRTTRQSRRLARMEAERDRAQAHSGVAHIDEVKQTSAAEATQQAQAHPELRRRSAAALLSRVADALTPPSLSRGCVSELLRRCSGDMDEAAFLTCLQALMRDAAGPDALSESRLNHALLVDVLRRALSRGFFRQRSGQSTFRWLLQSLVAAGEHARVVHVFDFLLVSMQRDHARALEQMHKAPPERDVWTKTLRTRIQLSGFTFTDQDDRPSPASFPVLHLDVACYVACMQSKLQLGLHTSVLTLATHTLPEVAAIEAFLYADAAKHSKHNKPMTDKALHVVQADAEAYLLAFRAACLSARASLARDLFIHALRCAEQDFSFRAVRIHRFMDKHDLLPVLDDDVAPDSQLAHLDHITHERLVLLANKLKDKQKSGQQQQQQHATAATTTKAPIPQSLSLPAFLLFDHSVFLLFIRSLLELALANFIGGAQTPEAVKTREAIDVLRNYLVNPLWIKLWLLDTPVTRTAQAGPDPAPASAVQSNPCVALELLLRVLESARDYSGILSLFQSVLVPAMEAANQWFVRELIRAGSVEAVGHPDQHNPAATFTASQRLRLLVPPMHNEHAAHAAQLRHSQLDALFTVVTIPPFLHPPVAALSAAVYDSVANAYCRIAQQSGGVSGSGIGRSHLPSARSSASASASQLPIHLFPFFRMVEARALMRTITINRGLVEHYCSDQSEGMQQRMRLYHDAAIGLPELLSLLQRLPGNQWPVCVQLTDFVVRGAVVPCLLEEEFWSAHEASTAASVVRPYYSSPSERPLVSPSSRRLLQSIYLELMSKLFSVRKFPQLLQLYEHDQRRYFSPPLPLSVEQSLLVLQSYAWVGNSERALELLSHFSPSYSPAQRVMSTAFMVHFLETHVLKAIKKLSSKRQPHVVIGPAHTQHSSNSNNHTQPSHTAMLIDPFAALPAPDEMPVPRVSSMGAPIVSPTGGPAYRAQSGFTVLPPWLGPSASSTSAIGSDLAALQVDAEVESKKVDAWKRHIAQTLRHRLAGLPLPEAQASAAQNAPLPSSPFSSGVPAFLRPSPLLFDAPEYLLPHSATLFRRAFGPHGVTGPLFSESPQGATLSFGSGSPAFSSYATTTAQVAAPQSLHPAAKAAQADPMIHWQLKQIHSCLAMLMRDAADALWFDAPLRRCDLRSGVSYNLGRCLLYLLSLWIKSHSGPTRSYQFLIPRSILRIKRTDEIDTQAQNTQHQQGDTREGRKDTPASSADAHADVCAPSPSVSASACAASALADATSIVVLSDLESVLLHSYSSEYLLSAYFPPSSLSVRVVDRSKLAQSERTAEWQGLMDNAEAMQRDTQQQKQQQQQQQHQQQEDTTEDAEAAAEPPPPSLQDDQDKRDAFGLPLSQQPFVIFTVKWP